MKIKRIAAEVGNDLYVGGKSYVTSNTYLGRHVCFNGMQISGNGEVKIGSYFHSGFGCQIITSFHNYEGKKFHMMKHLSIKTFQLVNAYGLEIM